MEKEIIKFTDVTIGYGKKKIIQSESSVLTVQVKQHF